VLGQIRHIIDTWIKQDHVKKIIEKSLRRNPQIGPQTAGEPFKLLKQYPSLCGVWLFSLMYLTQEAGVAFCNAWGSVMCTAHLYNAVRQEKLLQSIWKDMELVLLLQDDDNMFVGNRPKKAEGIYTAHSQASPCHIFLYAKHLLISDQTTSSASPSVWATRSLPWPRTQDKLLTKLRRKVLVVWKTHSSCHSCLLHATPTMESHCPPTWMLWKDTSRPNLAILKTFPLRVSP